MYQPGSLSAQVLGNGRSRSGMTPAEEEAFFDESGCEFLTPLDLAEPEEGDPLDIFLEDCIESKEPEVYGTPGQ